MRNEGEAPLSSTTELASTAVRPQAILEKLASDDALPVTRGRGGGRQRDSLDHQYALSLMEFLVEASPSTRRTAYNLAVCIGSNILWLRCQRIRLMVSPRDFQ